MARTIQFKSIFFIILLLTGCGDSPQLPRLAGDAVILAFGDSLTHGTGAREGESYPAVLGKLSGRKVINAGVPGEVSADGLQRLPALLDQHQPDLLILCHGGNDILRKKNLAHMAANVKDMIILARNKDIPVILLAVPNFGLFLSPAEEYGDIADATGVYFIDDLIPDVLADNAMKSDPVHPNKNGYRVIAQTLYQTLQSAGSL